jgi:hypothetical protein
MQSAGRAGTIGADRTQLQEALVTRVRRIAAIAALLLAAAPAAGHADPPVSPFGQCDGIVDVGCRAHECQPDELDCGLVPPCMLWVNGTCKY